MPCHAVSVVMITAYCLRCGLYRPVDEWFMWNLERGSHCTAEDCASCFRRGVRWCMLCMMESESSAGQQDDHRRESGESERPPRRQEEGQRRHQFPQALEYERAAADELCALVHWLFFVIDERLHAAVGQPLHAAWGQPHNCHPLTIEQRTRVEGTLVVGAALLHTPIHAPTPPDCTATCRRRRRRRRRRRHRRGGAAAPSHQQVLAPLSLRVCSW